MLSGDSRSVFEQGVIVLSRFVRERLGEVPRSDDIESSMHEY